MMNVQPALKVHTSADDYCNKQRHLVSIFSAASFQHASRALPAAVQCPWQALTCAYPAICALSAPLGGTSSKPNTESKHLKHAILGMHDVCDRGIAVDFCRADA